MRISTRAYLGKQQDGHTFYVGRRMREDRCTPGWHLGPAADASLFRHAGGVWLGVVTCESCGLPVLRSSIRGEAA
jgi:hypothetical protein